MPGPKLNADQRQRFKLQMVSRGTPVRFLYRGQYLDIATGELQKKGINILYQRHYWNFTVDTAKEIARSLGDVRAAFSE